MDRPSSVPVNMQLPNLPRPPSPYSASGRSSQSGKEETSKFVSSQHMADLKKENFSLKLKIYYLETTLSKVSGVEQFDVLNENVQLKVEKEGLVKELATNKELLIKASSVVDSLSTKQTYSENEGRLSTENEELQKLVSRLEHELLKAREDVEEKAVELEHAHTDCMLLEDQLLQKEEALKEQDGETAEKNEDVETLQAKLAAQEHLYQTDTDELKKDLDEIRDVMIKTHEENIGHRLTLAEKDETIRDLKDQLLAGDKTDESSEAGDSRASLLEALSSYTSTNARLEEELTRMEGTNTELNNVINNLNNEREALLEQLSDRDELEQRLKDYQHNIEELKQELHELRLSDSPEHQAELSELTAELASVNEENEELRHNITQLKINNDITLHEAAILRGNVEETEQEKQEEVHISKSLKQNIERLSKENADCSKENTVLQQENEMLREKVQELNNDICDLKEAARGLRKKSDSSNLCKINELSEELLSLKQSLSDANEELRYCKEDMKTLEGDYERTTEELELLEEELRESENKRVAATDEVDELREEFLKLKGNSNEDRSKWKQDRVKSDQELQEYQVQVSELRNDRERLEKNVKQLTKEKGKALFEVKKLEKDVSKIKAEHAKLEKEQREGQDKTAEEEDSFNALNAHKSYMEDRIRELEDTKRSLEDSVLSLKDTLSTTPLPGFYQHDAGPDEGKLKDKMIGELKSERDHHRKERKELENELRRIHELLHDLIRQLHKFNNTSSTSLQLKSNSDDFLVDSLKDAIELVINALTSRDRQVSNTSSLQTTSGVASFSDINNTTDHQMSDKHEIAEDLAALQRENSLLHTDLLESRELISALRKEMKDLLDKLNSTNTGDKHVRDMLTQISNLISNSLLQSPGKLQNGSLGNGVHHDSADLLAELPDLQSGDRTSEHRLTCQRLKIREARLAEVEGKLKNAVQELSNTECKLTSTQSKLAVANHKIQLMEQQQTKYNSRPATDNSPTVLLNQKIDSLQLQLQNTEELLKEKMKLIRDKNEVIDSLLDEKRSRSRCEDISSSYNNTSYNNTSYNNTSLNRSAYSIGCYSPPRTHDLTPSTIQVSDYILLCASNWLEELPELMRALRDAIHNSLVDCKSVQTRVNEKKATWAMSEVSRLSTRLDAVYRLLQHVENLSIQQPPSRLVHSLQLEVSTKDQELRLLNDKLVKRSKDIQKLRSKVEEQDKLRIKHKLYKNNLGGLNPSILSKVIDTETVLREAHKSLERRMVAKENQFS